MYVKYMFGAIEIVLIIIIMMIIIITINNNNNPIFTSHKVRSLRGNRSTNRGHLGNFYLSLK